MYTRLSVSLLIILAFGASCGAGDAQAQAGRGAAKGAAIGGILGLMLGDDLGDAVEGAAAGAAVGAVSGAIDESNRKRDAERAELERLRAREMEMLERERSQAAEDERRRLEQERLALAEERMRLEQQMASTQAAAGAPASNTPDDAQAWIDAIGQDNYNSAVALVDCEHDRAALLAQAGGTSSNPTYQLAAKWMETLIAVDRRDTESATPLFEELVILYDGIDNVQQASLETDRAILDVRELRRDEGISCQR